MSKTLDYCLAATARTYPAGYGFALGYLTDNPGPDHLAAMQAAAWDAVKPEALKGNPDAAAFVQAFTESRQATPSLGWRWWLVEAAQLVLASAMAGRRKSKDTLALWGHPGY